MDTTIFTGSKQVVLVSCVYGWDPGKYGPSYAPVHIIDTFGGDIGICLLAAAGMNHNGVITSCQFYEIWTYASHAAQGPGVGDVGKYGHHPGCTLHENLVYYVSFRNAAMGQGDFYVVYHHRVWTQVRGLINSFAGKAVCVGGSAWLLRYLNLIFDIVGDIAVISGGEVTGASASTSFFFPPHPESRRRIANKRANTVRFIR